MICPTERKVCLIVIDGWGISNDPDDPGDAVRLASHPTVTELLKNCSHTEIVAHGTEVGLPEGLMGNSEVGHLNIGAGRIVMQDIIRINKVVSEDSMDKLKNLVDAVDHCKKNSSKMHLLGLVSDGGVHSHIKHLMSILKALKKLGIPKCYIHLISDGRDTPPSSATKYISELQAFIDELKYGKIATIMGRYYAMDRDKRWERTKIAYEALVSSIGEYSSSPIELIKHERYKAEEFDEFLKPIIIDKEGTVEKNDSIITFNYRSDRMRQITTVLSGASMPFETLHPLPANLKLTTMTQYDEKNILPVLFPPQCMDNVIAEYISSKNLKQLHVAETEKYAHVTFFFNGGREVQFKGEDRILVPSPKVATYDLKPEMSVIEVAEKVAEGVAKGDYHFVMCNLAPPDMVGHTGKLLPTVKGVEATDKAIAIIHEACKAHKCNLFITSDHGNAEKMLTEDGKPITAHTTNKVFLISTQKLDLKPNGSLCDVAPTILDYMGIGQPKEMTGSSLIKK